MLRLHQHNLPLSSCIPFRWTRLPRGNLNLHIHHLSYFFFSLHTRGPSAYITNRLAPATAKLAMAEFGGNNSTEDLSLPKATVQKIIGEILPKDVAVSKDAREAITELSIEFIGLLSTVLNDIAEKEAKKTIASDHVVKALEELDFHNYLDIINRVLSEHKELLKGKEKKNNKFQNLGLSEEELLRQQEELFKKSRDRLNSNQG